VLPKLADGFGTEGSLPYTWINP